ncbi:FtsX-like permease family protein [Cellulomonas sp. NPDC057328]|uniref:FtsX-like permease family protein n=1 Tax=Cellulomonas sp. NPDC057328 TaxID=3346101 RepID=UPI00362A53D8
MTLLTTRARATTSDALLVARRRARQDAALLVGTAVLLLGTLLLALALPRLVERTADAAVRDTLRAAGTDADVIGFPYVTPGAFDPDYVEEAVATARWLTTEFDAGLGEPVASVRTPTFVARTPAGAFLTRLVTVVVPDRPATQEPVRWVAGTAPAPVPPGGELPDGTPAPPSVQVGLSAAAARSLGLTLDDGPVRIARGSESVDAYVDVTGLYEPVDPDDVLWRASGDLLGTVPTAPGSEAADLAGLYVPTSGIEDLEQVNGTRRLETSVRAPVDTDGMTLGDARALRDQVVRLTATTGSVGSALPDILDAFETRLTAARAQASLVVVGLGATGALCLVLAAGLLAGRRQVSLAGERARGASIASVVLRGLVETLPVVVLVAALAYAAVALTLPGRGGSVTVAAGVAVVAAVAPAVLAARTAAGAWTGRRVPADRRERARLVARRRARQGVVEALVVLLAVGALVAVRTRGLVPAGDGDVDPLLAAAPVLVSAAAALVVVRVAPAVVRSTGRLAARSRGLAAPLAVARAQGAATALTPLLAVTVAVALVVLSGVLAHSAQVGQQRAADVQVGADARLDGRLDTPLGVAALEDVAGAPGVDAVALAVQMPARGYNAGSGLSATVLAVDAEAWAQARAARGLPVDDGLAALATPSVDAPAGSVPALVSATLLTRTAEAGDAGPPTVTLPLGSVTLDVRGTTELDADRGAPPLDARAAFPVESEDEGLVVVDRAALAAAGVTVPSPDRAWVTGPGAAAAVDALTLPPPQVAGIVTTTRDGWWEAWSSAPLTSSLLTMQLLGVGVLALLLVLALVLVVVATARERGRTLSTLRTLGLDGRTARAATLGELAPLVLGGLVGGSLIGLAVPWLVADALGLPWLTGEPGDARLVPAAWPVLVAAAALLVALAVAVAVEQAVRRRDRLGEVLRVGER